MRQWQIYLKSAEDVSWVTGTQGAEQDEDLSAPIVGDVLQNRNSLQENVLKRCHSLSPYDAPQSLDVTLCVA